MADFFLKRGRTARSIISLLFFFASVSLFADFIPLKEGRGFLYPPAGWTLFGEMTDDSLALMDEEGRVVFQIMTFPADEFSSSAEIAESLEGTLVIQEKESSSFLYEGSPAILSDIVFSINETEHRGYFFFYRGEKYGFYLLAMTLREDFETQHDELLSLLDSFAPGEEALTHPGPVSQLLAPYPPRETQSVEIFVPELRPEIRKGQKDLLYLGREAQEISQVIIEREARLMLPYADEVNNEAWIRYYQMIMRDYHARLEPYARFIAPLLEIDSPREKAEKLLSWIQTFEYRREEGSSSDLLSPLTCAVNSVGDCDARALLYLSLLQFEGLDGVLMVSSEYSHAMAAVDVDGSGARFYPPERDSRGFVVAETTDRIDLGLIDRNKADPSKWVSVSFPWFNSD